MRGLVVLLAVLWIGMAVAAAAGPADLSEGDRAAIRNVITQQIDAFRRDDGAAAFGFASPGIQAEFGSVDHFMEMVRRGYQPVYRPSSVTFGSLLNLDGKLVQAVDLVGPDGKSALALYTMEREPDGSWRIAGCVLTTPPGETT